MMSNEREFECKGPFRNSDPLTQPQAEQQFILQSTESSASSALAFNTSHFKANNEQLISQFIDSYAARNVTTFNENQWQQTPRTNANATNTPALNEILMSKPLIEMPAVIVPVKEEEKKKKANKTKVNACRPQCTECGKDFSNQSALSKHKLIHSDERKFVCSLCSKAFKRQDHLNGHMLTHRDKKPFQCDVDGCDKTYCDQRSLRRHKENHHNAQQQQQQQQKFTFTFNRCIQYAPPQPSQQQSSQIQTQPQTLPSIQTQQPLTTASTHLQYLASQQQQQETKETFDPQNLLQQLLTQQLKDESFNQFNCEQIECNICKKKFKTVHALNGHMRLHGGYNIQQTQQQMTSDLNHDTKEDKKIDDVKSVVDVIKERILQKHSLSTSTSSTTVAAGQPPPQQAQIFSQQVSLPPPVVVVTSSSPISEHQNEEDENEENFKIDLLREQLQQQFNQQNEPRFRRYSDSLNEDEYESLRRRTSSRATSDPGATNNNYSSLLNVQFNFNNANSNTQQHSLFNSHSVPTTPTVQLNNNVSSMYQTHQPPPPPQQQQQPSHQIQTQTQTQTQHYSLPCTPTQPMQHQSMSFSFSPHQVQQYHQQQEQQQQTNQSLPTTPNETATTQFTYFNEHGATQQQQPQNLDDIYVNESDSNQVNFDETDFEMDVAFMEQMDKDNHAETQELFNFNNQNVEFMNNLISSVCQTTTTTSLISDSALTTNSVKKDDDVFVNPANVLNAPPLKKVKKSENILGKEDEEQRFKRMKHRPEPLYIPPYLNNCDQQPPQTARIQLKSPRISHPLSGKIVSSQNYSPPPYTPPPMLSPVRTNSGLYWHIISGSGTPIQVNAGSATPPIAATVTQQQVPTATVQTPYEDYIFIEEVQPHVNIGECFQARIPRYNPSGEFRRTNDVKMWDPCIVMDDEKEEDLNRLIAIGCSGCCIGGGRNEEFVHHLFYMFHGDFEKCLIYLLKPFQIKLNQQQYLNNYKYNETSKWNRNEIELYYQALIQAHKDFHSIAKIVSTKSVKECVEFYYLWKKVCPEEYKRLRIIRRKKEEEGIYWRKKEQQRTVEFHFDSNNNNDSEEQDEDEEEQQQQQQQQQHQSEQQRQTEQLNNNNDEDEAMFACRVCGRVFAKIKSRSAHMKIHHQRTTLSLI